MTAVFNLKRWLLVFALIFLNILLLNHFCVALVEILKFSFAVLLFTFIPGLLFLDCIGINKNDGYRFVLAAAAGICLDIILFIILSIFEARFLLYIAAALSFLLYLSRKVFIRDIKNVFQLVENLEAKYFYSLYILSILLMVMTIILYFLPNPLPGNTPAIFYYVDHPWHIANIAEIKNHWYPQDPRLAGHDFHYHVFFYIYTALLSLLSNISIPLIYFRLGIVFLFYLLFLAVYFTGSRCFNNRSAGIVHIAVFFFAGTCLLSPPFNIFLKNLYFSPTFLLASLLMLFIILEIREYLRSNTANSLLLIILLVFGVSGAKGSFFPVIFCGLLLCFIYSLFGRQTSKGLIILIGSSLGVFAIVFLYIFQGVGSEGINILPLEIIRNTLLFDIFRQHLPELSEFRLLLSFIPLYFFAFFSFRALALVNFSRKILQSIKLIPLENIFLAGIILSSFIAGYLLNYRGSSQYYYLFVGYIALNLISAGYIHKTFTGARAHLMIKLLIIVFLLGSAVDTVLMIENNTYIHSRLMALKNKPLTSDLYAGLLFLRDNTDKDSVIASYRAFLSEDNSRFFYYSAFSERRMLVEGWQYMSPVYQEEALCRYEDMQTLYNTRDADIATGIIAKYGIDYLIVDKHYKQKLKFSTDTLVQRRFTNNDIDIYQTIK